MVDLKGVVISNRSWMSTLQKVIDRCGKDILREIILLFALNGQNKWFGSGSVEGKLLRDTLIRYNVITRNTKYVAVDFSRRSDNSIRITAKNGSGNILVDLILNPQDINLIFSEEDTHEEVHA